MLAKTLYRATTANLMKSKQTFKEQFLDHISVHKKDSEVAIYADDEEP